MVELAMDSRVLIWRRPDKEWNPPCLNPGRRVRVSLVIWGCITFEGVGTLTVVDGNINGQKYIEVIDNFLWAVIARHFPDDNYVFQDDNAPVHKARVVKEYITETDLHGMELPAQSPYLHIIENVWHKIKHELQKHVQNITSRQLLETPIRNIWTEIPIDYIQDLYK